jgi:hypothetical protein
MKLLDGIHEDGACRFVEGQSNQTKSIHLLKQVSCARQIEISELMVSANNFTAGYAEALTLGTSKDQRTNPEEPKRNCWR